MSLVLAHVTTDPAEAVVLVSELEAGGFHPILFDYHHSFIALGYLQALGGIRIMLPEDEIEDAKAYLKLATPIEGVEPSVNHPVKDIVYASILSINPLFPLYLVSPILLIVLTVGLLAVLSYAVSESFVVSILESSVLLYILAMLAHAKYVAIPKLRENL